jgi:hypothetical protein
VSTVAELSLLEELIPLEEIAAHKGWKLTRLEDLQFMLGLPARDHTWFWLLCDCECYPAMPPAWHWYNAESGERDQPRDTPEHGGFFHSAGVICAPWNRLAYKSEDARGPHNDWSIGDWRANARTGGCTTLAAMALRIAVELQRPTFKGRRGS